MLHCALPPVSSPLLKSVLIASAGFPDHQAFTIARALYPNSLHITLPAAQIIQGPGVRYVEDFVDAVHTAARILVAGEDVDPGLVGRLNVEYSAEMKQMIREQANAFFEANIEG